MMDTLGIQYYNLLIACGDGKESTAEQYKKLDAKYNDFKNYEVDGDFHEMLTAFLFGRNREAFEKMYNVFESLYKGNETYAKIKRIMYENNAEIVMLSGSGPSVYGVFPNGLFAEDAQEALAKEGIASYTCNPINKEYEAIVPGKDPWN